MHLQLGEAVIKPVYITTSSLALHLFLFCRCDADPSALAKYVVALVKKDKSEKELKALCNDQLDVFLQKGNSTNKVFFFLKVSITSIDINL